MCVLKFLQNLLKIKLINVKKEKLITVKAIWEFLRQSIPTNKKNNNNIKSAFYIYLKTKLFFPIFHNFCNICLCIDSEMGSHLLTT